MTKFRNEPRDCCSKYVFKFKVIIKQYLALFTTVIQQKGAYIRGGVGLITGCVF